MRSISTRWPEPELDGEQPAGGLRDQRLRGGAYCSTSCTSDSDCSSGWDPYTCDPTEKLCNYCENCT